MNKTTLAYSNSDDEFAALVKNSRTIREVAVGVGYSCPPSGRSCLAVRERITTLGLKIDHFKRGKRHNCPRKQTHSDYYRRVCRENHGEKCISCGESRIWDGHHVDQNKKNNVPENLVPLCPTCHALIHRGTPAQMAELDQRVTNYLAKFKRKHKALYRDTSLVGRMLFMLRISNGTVIAS